MSGSYHVYENLGEVARLSVPFDESRALKAGLQRSLVRAAELIDTDFR